MKDKKVGGEGGSCCPHFYGVFCIHPVAAEIFRYGPMWWTFVQTDPAIYWVMSVAWLKTANKQRMCTGRDRNRSMEQKVIDGILA